MFRRAAPCIKAASCGILYNNISIRPMKSIQLGGVFVKGTGQPIDCKVHRPLS